MEVALQPTSGYKITMYSYANAVRTRDGGVHETGFKAALTKVVNDYALKWGVIKSREKDGFKPEVIQQGLNVVISVKLVNPQFQGQTKDRLNNAPVEGIVRSVVDEGLKEWFEGNTSRRKRVAQAHPADAEGPQRGAAGGRTGAGWQQEKRRVDRYHALEEVPALQHQRSLHAPSCSSWKGTPLAAALARAASRISRPY